MKILFISTLLLLSSCRTLVDLGFVTDGPEKVVIPFVEANNQILIPAKINNVNMYYILDTGISHTALSQTLFNGQRAMALEHTATAEYVDLHGRSQPVLVGTLPEFSLGGYSFNNARVIVTDFSHLIARENQHVIGGVIGMDIIKRCNWIINYHDKTITLTRFSLNGRVELPMEYDQNNRPHVTLNLHTVPNGLKTMLDTGYSRELLVVPPNYQDWSTLRGLTSQSDERIFITSWNSTVGPLEVIQNQIVELNRETRVRDVDVDLSTATFGSASIAGHALLKRLGIIGIDNRNLRLVVY